MAISRSYSYRPVDSREQRRRWLHEQYEAARSDAAIEEEIWHLILKDRSLGAVYQENITVEVNDSRVWLRGHTLKQWHRPLIGNIVNRVEGVLFVRNELVADNLLQDQVIQALLEDAATSPYIFTVRSRFGWVSLGGLVPTREIAKAAEGVAGTVPAVRGILSLPSVFSEHWSSQSEDEPARRTFQPRQAAPVYQDSQGARSAVVGIVSQVLIDPCSRLVSALGVRVNGQGEKDQGAVERLVPVAAVEAVSDAGVWLKENEAVDQYSIYDRRQFPLPPASWKPPFPYLPGTVRWSVTL